ncbi:MAG TPA: class I SAM-dependent methyltransferase [Anaerolineae bacterium]|nr:class I SAM-dependent methyltransferase [Anaerolineae bacterium]
MQNILSDQINYYRARADEYDESISSGLETFEAGKSLLSKLGRFDQILELACGTGVWTETLLKMGNHVTAVDAAPEMLKIAREKCGDERITYQQADLFNWQPDKQYDMVFFANWLSHVPPNAIDDFLNKVKKSLHKNGTIAFVDQHAPSDADKAIAEKEIYAKRPLGEQEFTIVKVFYDLGDLQKNLESLGFEVSVEKFGENFFLMVGKD